MGLARTAGGDQIRKVRVLWATVMATVILGVSGRIISVIERTHYDGSVETTLVTLIDARPIRPDGNLSCPSPPPPRAVRGRQQTTSRTGDAGCASAIASPCPRRDAHLASCGEDDDANPAATTSTPRARGGAGSSVPESRLGPTGAPARHLLSGFASRRQASIKPSFVAEDRGTSRTWLEVGSTHTSRRN